MPYEDHKEQATDAVTCAILTISDTRTEEDDKSGAIIKEILADTGHNAGHYQVVPDDAARIREKRRDRRFWAPQTQTSSSPGFLLQNEGLYFL